MTLNSSGPISLAGTTTGVSIEIENGGNGTTQISLNDTAVRTLAGVPSGAITMPTNFYGKSNSFTGSYTFTTSTSNASLNLSSISGYIAGKSTITITVNSGVYLWATTTANYGLNLSGGTTGDTFTLVNNGYIMGKGGAPGGPALNVGVGNSGITINNVGYIGGGGGNGGYFSGGGGAGGSGGPGCGATIGSKGVNGGGYPPGSCCSPGAGYGGAGGRIFPGCGGAGNGAFCTTGGRGGGAGGGGGNYFVTSNAGGAGGAGSAAGGNYSNNYAGGGGGGWGATGGTGRFNCCINPGAAGGKAINKNGKTVTFSGGCTRVYGAVS